MKIYIAGHSGLVGSSLKKILEEDSSTPLLVKSHTEVDLCRQTETENFFKEERPDYVYLAAAKVGGILANKLTPAEFIYNNLSISSNIIHSSYKFGVKKLLNLGSSCIYPKFSPQPMKEEYLLTSPLESSNEAYSIAKIMAIKLCKYYNEQYGTNFISIMPCNLYGDKDNYNLETSHILPALLRKFHLAKLLQKKDFEGILKDLRKTPITNFLGTEDDFPLQVLLNDMGVFRDKVILWGSGEVYREFLHAGDLARACVFLMQNFDYKEIGEIINIGSGEDIKIKDLAHIVQNIVGFDGAVEFSLNSLDGVSRKLLDVTKIAKLGWRPTISLEEGVRDVYESYQV